MAAVFAFTQTDTVVGTFTNGRKLVSTVVTVTGTGFGAATPVTIKPLMRVIKFFAAPQLNGAPAGIIAWAADATYPNIINGTAAASANGDKIEILSIGI